MKVCGWTNNYLVVETDGWTRPCCLEPNQSARIAPINEGIMNAFNNKKLIMLHQELTNGYSDKTQFACRRCEQVEKRNEPSLRSMTSPITEDRELRVIQFKLSNKCQLACAHCGPALSSTWAKLEKISPHVINSFSVTEEFLNEMVQLLPQLDVIKFTGGEPFLDPNHWKILKHLMPYDRSHIKLEYITNGLVKPKLPLWAGWKEVSCAVSVDGHKETYEWFRRGAVWNELLENILILKEHSNLSIAFCMTPWTVQSYNDAIEFWDMPISFQPVVYPKKTSFEEFPKDLAVKLANNHNAPLLGLASETGSLAIYRDWAIEWDKKWNTVGLSNKIYPWLYE